MALVKYHPSAHTFHHPRRAVFPPHQESVLALVHKGIVEKLLERQDGGAVYRKDDVTFTQSVGILLALLPYQCYHRAAVHRQEGNVGLLVAHIARHGVVERLEDEFFAAGVDDDVAVVENARADAGVALGGERVVVVESEEVPLHGIKPQKCHLARLLGPEGAYGAASVAHAFHLCLEIRKLFREGLPTLPRHLIQAAAAGVETGLVDAVVIDTHLDIGHPPHQTVFGGVARFEVKVLVVVGEHQHAVLHVDFRREAFVEEVEAYHRVEGGAALAGWDVRAGVASDHQAANLKVGVLHHLYLARVAVGVVRGDGAQLPGIGKVAATVDDALARAGVKTKPVFFTAYGGTQVDLVVVELDGDTVYKIFLRDGEFGVVTIRLGMCCHAHY